MGPAIFDQHPHLCRRRPAPLSSTGIGLEAVAVVKQEPNERVDGLALLEYLGHDFAVVSSLVLANGSHAMLSKRPNGRPEATDRPSTYREFPEIRHLGSGAVRRDVRLYITCAMCRAMPDFWGMRITVQCEGASMLEDHRCKTRYLPAYRIYISAPRSTNRQFPSEYRLR